MDGCPRLVEHGARRDRDLVVAFRALPEESLRQFVSTVGPTGRAPESIRPAAGEEVLTTGGVIREATLELNYRPGKIRARHAEIVPELTG